MNSSDVPATPLPYPAAMSLNILRIVIPVLAIPAYSLLLWVILARKHLNVTVSNVVIANVAVLDIVHLFGTLFAAFMSFFAFRWWPVTETFAYIFYTHQWALLYLFLTLSLHRLFVALDFTFVALVLIWTVVLIVFPIYLHFYLTEMYYSLSLQSYAYLGAFDEDIIMPSSYIVFIALIVVHALIVVILAYKKLKLGKRLKLTSYEFRLLLQSVLLLVPFVVLAFFKTTFLDEVFYYATLQFLFLAIVHLIPVNNLLMFLIFDSKLLKEFTRTLLCKKSTTTQVYDVQKAEKLKNKLDGAVCRP